MSAQTFPQADIRKNYYKSDSTLKNIELDSIVITHSGSEIHSRNRDTTGVGAVIETDTSLTVELHGLKSSCGDEFYYEYNVTGAGILTISVFEGPVCQGGYSTDVILYFSKFPEKKGLEITGVALEGYCAVPVFLRKK